MIILPMFFDVFSASFIHLQLSKLSNCLIAKIHRFRIVLNDDVCSICNVEGRDRLTQAPEEVLAQSAQRLQKEMCPLR